MKRVILGAIVLSLAACDKKPKQASPPPPPPPPAEVQEQESDDDEKPTAEFDSDENLGSIRGIVKLKIPLATQTQVQAQRSSDPACPESQATSDDAVVVDGVHRLRNVYVFLENPPPTEADPPDESIHLAFKDCRLSPQAVVLRYGQALEISNRDAIAHTAVSLSSNPKAAFKVELAPKSSPGKPAIGLEPNKKGGVEEIAIACGVHGAAEQSHVYMSAHRFTDITRDDGSFEIRGLPDGTYRIAASYAGTMGYATSPIEIAKGMAKGTAEIMFAAASPRMLLKPTMPASPGNRSASPGSSKQ